jgi:nucleoside-diphosphate-sugar epimerase
VYGDGTSGRDYTYVDDIVDGIVRASERRARFISGISAVRTRVARRLGRALGAKLGSPEDRAQAHASGRRRAHVGRRLAGEAGAGLGPPSASTKGWTASWPGFKEERQHAASGGGR